MTFSVIIPTYNRAHIIVDTVNSVLAQTLPDFEVIVVDDGSTDNTRAQVEGLKNPMVRYFYKENEERSVARNFGAAKATGRYLIFLDSDDRMHNEHLARIYQYILIKEFKPKFLFGGFVVYTTEGKKLYQYKKRGRFRRMKLMYGNYLGCSSVVVERELFERHRFNTTPELVLFEDWELWLRLISEEDLYCIPAASIIMINHKGRSVLNYSPMELATKALHFYRIAISQVPIISRSAFARRRFAMGLYSYVALHIALAKKSRLLALRYLLKAFGSDPTLLLRRRLYAIVKQML